MSNQVVSQEALEDYLLIQHGVTNIKEFFKRSNRTSIRFHSVINDVYRHYSQHSFDEDGLFRSHVKMGKYQQPLVYEDFKNFQHVHSIRKLNKELSIYRDKYDREMRRMYRYQKLKKINQKTNNRERGRTL